MPSLKVDLPADSWIDVSLGYEKGTITHYTGYSNILFVQSASIPTLTPPIENAIADVLDPKKDKVKYFSGLASQKIWACSLVRTSTVVTTEAEI